MGRYGKGGFNSRAHHAQAALHARVRRRRDEQERLAEEHQSQTDIIISEILRCMRPQYLDLRKANKYIKKGEETK